MVKCCAIGCRNPGTHIFPKDNKLKILWEKAVNRKNFIATKHSRLCSEHFTSDDYIAEGFYTGLQNKRKILRKGVVPTSFIKFEKKICNKVIKQSYTTNSSITALNSVNKKSEQKSLYVESGPQKLNHCSIGTQKFFCFFSIDSFKDDNKKVYFYTGLKTYALFIKVFQSLGPDAESLCFKRNQDLDLSPREQFLLTLTKLKRDQDDYELALFIEVHQSSIANIVITWVNFIYSKWTNKYKINNQMNVLAEGVDNVVMDDVLYDLNSFNQEEIISKSTIENVEKIFSIIKGNKDKMYAVLLPKIIYICKILIYLSKDVKI